MIGPVMAIEREDLMVWWANWYWSSSGDVADITLTSYATNDSLEEAAAHRAQTNSWQVIKNEPITLSSGRSGRVIVAKSWEFPNDLMSATVILVWNGFYYGVTFYGATYDGTYDYEYLLGTARTLCAE